METLRPLARVASLADPSVYRRQIRKPDGTPKRCHAHMFRDTFAVELLNKGVPIDRVSLLLGHSSVKVTEKHYAPLVKERQQQLESYARMAWDETAENAEPPRGTPSQRKPFLLRVRKANSPGNRAAAQV
jgi:integrase